MRINKLVYCGFLLTASLLTGCKDGPVFDTEGDCDPHMYIQFVFDKNMEYNANLGYGHDVFSTQVGSVDVYIFNPETGEYIAHYAEAGEALRADGYRMELDLEPGSYEIIAWCGLSDNEDHFVLPENINKNDELRCRMARQTDSEGLVYSDVCLKELFHGRIDSHTFPDEEGEHVATVYLTRDTNYIQLAMQHHGKALDPSQFLVTMDDANGYLAHDNSLLKDDDIQYRPWSIRGGVVDLDWSSQRVGSRRNALAASTRADEDGNTGFLVTELATSRLMENRNPYLKVTDTESGKVVFSLPFVEYVSMMKSDRFKNMDLQEYLDREHEYEVMVFLENDDDEGWRAVQIIINGWHKIDNGNVGI